MRLLQTPRSLAFTASALAMTLALGSPAYAQDADATTQADPPEVLEQTEVDLESGQDADATGDQQIIVTGSRIRTPNLVSSVPITSVGAQDLTDTGDISLGDAVNQLPALRSTFSQANSTRFIGTAGLSLLDLRGLGSARTLVLVNGRRHVSSTPGDFRVDVNTIPVDLLERVDVITGGNSAIYGSDAISGVVNFVLKRDFEGIKVRGQGGISSRGDRGSYFVSGIAGKNFWDDRANVAVAVEYSRSNPLYFADRPGQTGAFDGPPGFFTTDVDIACTGQAPDGTLTPANCDADIVNGSDGIPDTSYFDVGPKFGIISLGGTVLTVCPAPTATNQARRDAVCTGQLSVTGGRLSDNYVFLPDGTLVRDPVTLDLRPSGGGRFGGLTATGVEGAMLLPGLERASANLLLNAEVSTAFQPFLEAKFVRITANQTSTQPTFVNSRLSPVFSINNPFLSDQARATISTITGGASAFTFFRFNNDIGTRAEDHERETYRIVGGFRGDLSTTGNLNYEVALNYGRTDTYYETGGNVHVQRFNQAANAVLNGSGQIVCAINNDANPANDDPACVPINLFGEGAPSQAAIDYVLHTSSRDQWAKQINAIAFVSGDTSGIFELPGGPIGAVAGVEYRKEDAYSDYDDVTQAGDTFLNAFDTFAPPAIEVKEAFGELRLPLLANAPFFHELTLEGAVRASDYSSQDELVWAYNVGAVWAPISDIRLRAGYARSVRAPNLGDLYATRTETFANNLVDPCNQTVITQNPNRARNCAEAGIPTTLTLPDGRVVPWTNNPASGISGFNQGNPNLSPEVGKSITLGAVLQPRFLPGFSLTIDYYDIEIEQAISGLTGQAIINRCYDDPVSIDNPFCDAVFRRRSSDPYADFTFEGQSSRRLDGFDDVLLPVIGPGFLNQPFNFQSLKTSGVDFDAAYRKRLDSGTTLNLRAVVSWLRNREFFTFITDPDRSTRVHGTLGDPEWSGSFSANVDFGLVDFDYDLRFLDRMTIGAWETQFSHQGRPPQNADAFPFTHYPRVFYHDIQVGFEPADRYRFYMGVDNIFDRLPPYGLTGTGEGSGAYPVQGRFFYAGAEVRF